MASFYPDGSRPGCYRVQLYVRGVRRKLWLGKVTKLAARTICSHLDALNVARETATRPPESTARWVSLVSPRIRSRLVEWGLVQQGTAASQLPTQLAAFCDAYLASRTDWKPKTLERMANVRRHLVQILGDNTTISAITPGDAERFARWCRSNFASQSHAGKTISSAKQYFTAAVRFRMLAENPFDGLSLSQPHDRSREAYVSAETTRKLLLHACPYYSAVISIARFGGLRMPSELLQLEWSHIDWENHRLTVHSPKTETTKPVRVIPLFPEFRPALEELYAAAPAGSVYVFDRYRTTAAKVYRASMLRILTAAGIDPWPKLWMNLRASCRTDLLERFPDHVVNYWLGHTGKVGTKHYDRVHDGHYSAACGVACGVTQPLLSASDRSEESAKH